MTHVAIGSFDGVHRGHQAVIGTAQHDDLKPVVLTFEPLPREYLDPASAPARLQSLRDRVETIRALGVEQVRVLRFNAALSREPAEAFVERVLVAKLGARRVSVGEGFRFGYRRGGDVDLLGRIGAQRGFEVNAVKTLCEGGERISSTRIRAALAEGDLASAAGLLGRPYAMAGRVVPGDRRGHSLGFPTANLVPRRGLPLADGVYAVTVKLADGTACTGAAHWGTRAWLGGTERRLEVHLLDFDGDLYVQRIGVEFRDYIRADRDFDGIEAMQRQIEVDIRAVRDTIRGL
jgi:riboflavin kinase / FMN adenylyltransferase